MKSGGTARGTSHGHQRDGAGSLVQTPSPSATESQQSPLHSSPIIDVSESDGAFNVYADFSGVSDRMEAGEPTIEFARQGVVLKRGPVERYIPIPTDCEIDRAKVSTAGGIVRISVPTADLGHRWRSIVMW